MTHATDHPSVPHADAPQRVLKGTMLGNVVSDRREKTRKVEVNYLVRAPKYGKYVRRRTIFHVHDPQETSRLGDRVEIARCRPISKTKSWRLVRVVEAAAERTHD